MLAMSQINGEAVLAWEINQFTGVNEHHKIEGAEIISQRDYTVWVRTSTDSLTFHRYKSVMYSDMVEKPLVAYGKRKIVLILPKK